MALNSRICPILSGYIRKTEEERRRRRVMDAPHSKAVTATSHYSAWYSFCNPSQTEMQYSQLQQSRAVTAGPDTIVKCYFPHTSNLPRIEGQHARTSCRVLPALSSCAFKLNIPDVSLGGLSPFWRRFRRRRLYCFFRCIRDALHS